MCKLVLKIMLKSLFNIYLYHTKLSATKSLRSIFLVFWLLNFLTSSFIYSKTDILTETGKIPVHTLIDSDLTSPGKLFFIQNETLRITESLKVQPLFSLNLAVLSKTDLHHKSPAEISTANNRNFLFFVFIETTNPRSPPHSLI